MKLIQPEMDRITKAYKNNQEMLSRKTLELRRQHGIGLMPKGCFAPFIAYPLLIAFFAVFNSMAQAQNQLLMDNIKTALEGSANWGRQRSRLFGRLGLFGHT